MTIYVFITMALAFAGLLFLTLREREDTKRLDWLDSLDAEAVSFREGTHLRGWCLHETMRLSPYAHQTVREAIDAARLKEEKKS